MNASPLRAPLDQFPAAEPVRSVEDGRTNAGSAANDRIAQLERELRDAHRRLAEMTRLAYVDSLSGLGNRRAFDDEMLRTVDRARRYQMPAVVALFDIDRFKEVNDLYGHDAGDAMIVAIGQCLRSQIRASDFVARIGGDEFAVILSNIAFEDACQRVELLSEAVCAIEYKLGGEMLQISVSVGTSAVEADPSHQPLRAADQAMYRRKRAARTIYNI
ncbi:GGDEF domain-containing protein [Bosea sp. PAMC 26642]|uniref:GGDEF domain-containing protein n=1 Tax=Bosea sp. (strain PAMC 26642) TaxID=1792307 RepID=UPI00077036BB|nr:GGDEF domain-containing protein [Bosea sp. PAMC 26642]AMJ61644.1 hypothetical protein AXW83_16210 [Bosea sp. PAMC 26642]